MKKIIKTIMVILLFPFSIITLPIFILGWWTSSKKDTFSQSWKHGWKEWVLGGD